MKRILCIRTDRIGDAILTIPAIHLLKKYKRDSEIYFMVKKRIAPLFENDPNIKEIIGIEENESLKDLLKKIKKYDFDVSINFFVDRITPIATFLAKIPLRIGPFSKLSSIFLNKRIKQNRKRSTKHEADYNIELLSALNIPFEKIEPRIYLPPQKTTSRFPGKAGFVIIHPGGGKRGKPLPVEKYIGIANFLKKKNVNFLISIGPEDKELKTYFKNFTIIEDLSIIDFAHLISESSLFISNSTGPLHLAVALGIPTISFFGKEKTISPVRWGPYSEKKMHKVIFTEDFNISEFEKVLNENI